MSSFSQDKKWVEAKKAVGRSNWLEVVSYYRSIDGKNVFVYSVIEGKKRLIVDVLNDDTVLLIDRDRLTTDSYESVLNSKKVFKYNEDHSEQEYLLHNIHTFTIATESHKENGSDT